jgi:rhodanese-related sulfurtransferase
MKNSILTLLFACNFLFFASCNSSAQSNILSADQFEKAIASNNIQILDVRTAEEYNSGHIANALQADWTNQKEFIERVAALDKTKPVYLYCLSGGRSGAAMQWMQKNGFSITYNLQGGMNAWKQANKHVEGKSDETEISLASYNKLVSASEKMIVDFGAKWCPPCRKMQPVIDTLKLRNYNVLAIDGGAQTQLAKDLKVGSFPTFIIYHNGKEVWRKTGIIEMSEFIRYY